MERKIKFSDLKKAVEQAYEECRKDNEGTVDPRIEDVDDSKFGISVMLTDGTEINVGDVDEASAMGAISKIPTHLLLNSQISPEEMMKKAGMCCVKCQGEKVHFGISKHAMRAVSLIEPTGDADGKWDIMINNIINMMGTSPVLDDKLYEKLKANEAEIVEQVKADNYTLADDTNIVVDLVTRLDCMKASAKQLAQMGATIAADGVNPKSGEIAFDGELAKGVVAAMAVMGPHKMRKPWLIISGLPAKSSFAGAILGVFPGVGAIAAYSPKLNAMGVSERGAKALIQIMKTLDISVFDSARPVIEK